MVLRPIYDPSNPNMSGYPPSGPPPGYERNESGEHQFDQYRSQWQGNPDHQARPPYAMASPPPGGGQSSYYGAPYGSPQPPHSPQPGGYYPPQQPQYADHPASPPPAGQYPHSPGHGYHGSPQGQRPYMGYQPSEPLQSSSPYQAPSQPQYAQSPRPLSSQGYPPVVKQEFGSPGQVPAQALYPGATPQSEQDRGVMGALAGGAAGAFAGHKVNHGFLGALGGAFAGHKLQDAYSDHKKHSRPSSRRSSSSSSSSSDDDKHHNKPPPQQQPYYGHAAPPPPPPAAHGGLRGNFSHSASRISLDRDHDLIAECATVHGSRKLTSISLNRLLTNDDGHFRWSREGNFAGSARNIRLVHDGKYLEAELCRRDGSWRTDQICLDERIENSNGDLQMLW
ncbi:hypothetical protein PFICI_04802 [Pestalotiopsis fici W106-1]|uniref:Cyanovirin-N domain-containing protein n=1 Tax=Pestalotiopsis fici (strain W106-1 / CGMCC3.15140) TaxID=1229662 RepID=W3XCM2_PESFW|nr:uncharacterized protein PFICI_04802 [Pestalotiopsis fici W106-1]ETS82926.1 hypothetical protein PFICI_04802 [Pestalotiopsis fici W106-1]